jgi:phenylacetate-CoA ligase
MALQAQALRERIHQEGFSVGVIPTNPRLPAFLEKLPGLRAIVKTGVYLVSLLRAVPRVAVVHVLAASYFYFFARVTPAVFICRAFGRRVIVNYRGGEAFTFFRTYGWLARPTLRFASTITVPSIYLKRCFEEQGFACKIVGNLANIDRFRFRRRTQLEPKLVVTRSLEPMYNVQMALRAFQVVKKARPDATLDVIGTGSDEARLKAFVTDAAIHGVRFYGAVRNEDIPFFLDRADILLNPTNVDNLPMNLLEAFASGLAVVSTNAGGIADLLSGCDAASLVAPGDYLGMAERVLFLLNHPAEVESRALAGRKLAEEYSWERIRETVFDVYFPDAAGCWLERVQR